jgi:photosystem II stability/assembly factor-like uncharacterized protein
MPAGSPEAVRPIPTEESTILREAAVLHHPISAVRGTARVVLTVTLLGWVAVAGRTQSPDAKAQQIADLKKQIEERQAKLAELEKTPPASAAPSVSPEGAIPQSWVSALAWRPIGPATMGGRITAISVFEADPTTYWVASASGGLLKTTNHGITFEHQFDKESTVSIGDVCVAPSDRDIVWVGTGEGNPRNSVSYGDGVYKSTDGGKTWKNMGLRESFQIGRIIVHPTDPNIVYVGALGRLYGPNAERGVFKTCDGGKSWERVLYVDDKTGCVDMRMNPAEPNTLIAAMWERKRDEFDSFLGDAKAPAGTDTYGPAVNHGKGGGIFRTTDAGKTWKKLDKGLPNVATGRIGLDWYRKDPKVVFAIVDTEKVGTGVPPPAVPYFGIQGEDAPGGVKLTEAIQNGPAAKAGLKTDDLLIKIDDKPIENYEKMVEAVQAKKVGDKVKFAVKRGDETKEITVTLEARPPAAGGGGGGRGGRGGQGGGRGGQGGQGGGFGAIPADQPWPGFIARDTEDGIRVRRVTEDSSAAKAGITADDMIVEVDGKKVGTFQGLLGILREKKIGDKVKFTVQRGEEKKSVQVTLEEFRPPAGFAGGQGGPPPGRPYGSNLGGQVENRQTIQGPEGHQTGGVYKSTDGGESWTRINSVNPRPMYFSQVRVDPSDDKLVYVLGVSFYSSNDGGKTFRVDRQSNTGVHSDQHTLWINPKDGRHMLIGSDGGFYVTFDRMKHWEHLTLADLGQFYHVCLDNRKPYRVYGGLQDNGSWAGPSRTLRNSGPINEDWFMIGGGDGFVCRVDPDNSDLVYSESQDGGVRRRNLQTGEGRSLRARAPASGEGSAPRGDGPPAGGGGGRRGESANTPQHRYNWNTPFILSAHNPGIMYIGAEVVFRSLKHGDDLKVISPEITRTKHGSATAMAESPRNPDILWAGTDDGALWVTRDGGHDWKRVDDKVGLPGPRWVSTIEASRYADGRAYVCFDAHRSDDDKPYLYVTEDFGATWKPLNANLPAFGSTRCLREDVQNPNLLVCGTEFGVWASNNRGGYWTKINNNLPTVAVHELAIHPTAGEMVAATHGRSLWVVDISALRQMTPEAVRSTAHLYAPPPAIRWRSEPDVGGGMGAGSKKFVGQNPPRGVAIYYSLGKKAEKTSLKVLDYAGQTVRELNTNGDTGLHKVVWDMRRPSTRTVRDLFGGQADPEQIARRGNPFTAEVPAGQYRVVLAVDGKEYSQGLRIEADPTGGGGAVAVEPPDDEDDDPDRDVDRDTVDRLDPP